MNGLQSYRPTAQAINMQCEIRDRSPRWWGKMLTNIVLAVGPDQSSIKYVTAQLAEGRYEIAVLTDKLLVAGSVEEAGTDDAPFTVRVLSLNDVTTVTLNAEASIFTDEAFIDWPGRVRVGVTHSIGGEFQFPYSSERNNHADEKLAELLPQLLDRVKNR